MTTGVSENEDRGVHFCRPYIKIESTENTVEGGERAYSSISPPPSITNNTLVTACEETLPIQKPRIRVAAISERTERTEQGQSIASLEPRAASSLCPTEQPEEEAYAPVPNDNAFVPESNSPVEILQLKTPMESLLAKIAPNGEYDEASSPPLTSEPAFPLLEPDLNEGAELQNRLRMQIDRFLGEEAAEEIRKKCIFVKTEPGKMLIKIHGKLALSEHQRLALRNAIYSVYGDGMRITQAVSSGGGKEVEAIVQSLTAKEEQEHYAKHRKRKATQHNKGAKIVSISEVLTNALKQPVNVTEQPIDDDFATGNLKEEEWAERRRWAEEIAEQHKRDLEQYEKTRELMKPWDKVLERFLEEGCIPADEPVLGEGTLLRRDRAALVEQFKKAKTTIDPESKHVTIHRKTDLWGEWFRLNFQATFESYFAAEGFSFSVV